VSQKSGNGVGLRISVGLSNKRPMEGEPIKIQERKRNSHPTKMGNWGRARSPGQGLEEPIGLTAVSYKIM